MKKIFFGIVISFQLLAESGTIMIEVAYEGDNYSISRAWKIEKKFPPTLGNFVKSDKDIMINIKDKKGDVIDVLRIENPRIIRGILSENENEEGHRNIQNEKGSFIVRYRYDKGLKYLNIINASEENNHVKGQNVTSIQNNDLEFGSLIQ